MNKTLKVIGGIVVGIIIICLLIILAFGLEMGGLKWKGYFAPKHEAVRRQVFKETRSFNEGKAQELAKLRAEYLRAKTDEDKVIVKSIIRTQFADYDYTKLNPELQKFLKEALY